jgi:Ca2+-binding EF-hand superfamily protein
MTSKALWSSNPMVRMDILGLAVVTAASVMVALPASAQSGQRGAGGAQILSQADQNGDGIITAAELTAARVEMFTRLDRNQDGQLAGDELRQRLAQLDANNDGTVTATEFTANQPRWFGRFDANSNGQLEASEVTAARTAMAERSTQAGRQQPANR